MAQPTSPIAADWPSLISRFSCPDWFRDAKFGVWSHWGPQAVPGQGDWYARFMYMEDQPEYRYHCRTYGHPSKVGYKDIIEKWTASKLDTEELIGFYADNGAKYFMGMLSHCDNFDLFNSKHHPWNSVNRGPKRDILGEYAKASRNAGLRFGFSEHLTWSYGWFNTNKGADSTGPYAGVPYDGNDPANASLYFEPHDDTEAAYPQNPSPFFVENWKARMIDAIDQFQPDMFYTDGGIFEQAGLDVMAHFYNQAADGVYTYKNVPGRRPGFDKYLGQYQAGAGIEDLEHGVLGSIIDEPWQTDTSSGPWFWNPSSKYKTPAEIIHMLADIVSKNGNLLLNYTQRPDGSLDDETHWTVEQVGKWLNTCGEAIYGTRPWRVFGEGPTQIGEGEMGLQQKISFGAEDFRYTQRDNVVYAISLGRPSGGKPWVAKSLSGESIADVTLLGYNDKVEWSLQPDGLHVQPPSPLPGDLAWPLRIEFA
ncbi:alpha-L-fucosidase [Algisphaera agarilytica]|uniref:alpha-L-fucosidase n=1 Tax=Algisphaera agarilytica TaxID=1385975 RepID=A0A7X0HBB9_9BACT|nr:alpha-L-fucosidase [Algisphaera agarilytica]MBB6431245.1 alpha-L-fucosidase [Algisphaera agarilytica]